MENRAGDMRAGSPAAPISCSIAKCKMQNANLQFAFCILQFAISFGLRDRTGPRSCAPSFLQPTFDFTREVSRKPSVGAASNVRKARPMCREIRLGQLCGLGYPEG